MLSLKNVEIMPIIIRFIHIVFITVLYSFLMKIQNILLVRKFASRSITYKIEFFFFLECVNISFC